MLINRYLHQNLRFIAVFIAVVAGSLTAMLGLSLAVAPAVYADSYTVNASVPYSPPDQPAVIQPDLNGSTAHDALVTISGTCQVKQPSLVVSIWRDGSPIGSASCDGSFTVQVMLLPGANNLTARTSNISGTYGPDSSVVAITLTLPADPRPPVVTDKEPASLTERALATGAAADDGLSLLTADPFSVLSTRNAAALHLIVSGGTQPYTVSLNWGNGTEEVHSIAEPGAYSYEYSYKKPGNYMLHGWIRDSHGAYAEFSYAIVSDSAATPLASGASLNPSSPAPKSGILDLTGRLPVSVASAGAVGGIALLSFWLGAHHLVIGSVQQASAAFKSARLSGNTAANTTTSSSSRSNGRKTVRRGKTIKPKRNRWGIIKP